MKQFLRETNEFFSETMPETTRSVFYVLALVWFFSTIFSIFGLSFLVDRLTVLTPEQAVFQVNIWQFVTYIFSHHSFLHFFFNALVLFFFGPPVEGQMGSRRFLWFLILCGFAGGVLHTIVAFSLGMADRGLIGFSGAGFGILAAAVIWFPRMRVLFMLLFPVPLRVLAAFFGVIWILSTLAAWQAYGPLGTGTSELAHIAGVVMGVLLIRNPGILDWWEDKRIPFIMRRQPRMVRRSGSMGHPGRHSDPDDLYDDPHWKLDQ